MKLLLLFAGVLAMLFAPAEAGELHHRSDGLVIVRGDAGVYVGTLAQLEADSGLRVPSLPPGVDQRVYEQGKQHALLKAPDEARGERGLRVVGAGDRAWKAGDDIVGRLPRLLAAMKGRRVETEDEAVRFLRNALKR